MFTYNKVTPAITNRLITICGENNVLFNDQEKLETYSKDQVMEKKYAHFPDVVVKAENTQQIAEIMKLANTEKIPVTPRGAGSGLSGGAVPIHGGIVLSLEKMNRILEIDRQNLVVVVEPGVITNEINEALKEDGLFFAGYPMSVESCQVGGNIAENAGGGRAVKYGVTGRYILGLEVVTPEGEILNLGGKIVKDVTGYDLIKLLTGSEGTLGIITKAIIKLMPLPKHKVVLLAIFEDFTKALETVPRIITETKIIPASLEFMDQLSVATACRYLNEKLPYEKAAAMLLIELDGNSKEELEKEYEMVGDLCQKHGAYEVYIADNRTTMTRVWRIRQNIGEAFAVFSSVKSSEDIVVPIAAIATVMPQIKAVAEKYDIIIPCFGHAGDGNIHTTLVKKPEMSMETWNEIIDSVQKEVYQAAVDAGGTISGEHGIGHKKKKFLSMSLDNGAIEMMRRIKRAFDPNNILNPGKIFDI